MHRDGGLRLRLTRPTDLPSQRPMSGLLIQAINGISISILTAPFPLSESNAFPNQALFAAADFAVCDRRRPAGGPRGGRFPTPRCERRRLALDGMDSLALGVDESDLDASLEVVPGRGNPDDVKSGLHFLEVRKRQIRVQ